MDTSINIKNKYNFWNMFVSIVGVVIGIGIFFKNDSIYNLSGNNPLIAIITWVVGALLIIGMAYSFVEISSVKLGKTENGSITEWANKFLGKKGGVIISTYWHYIYIPLTYLVLATFSTDMIVSAITTANPTGNIANLSNVEIFGFYFLIIMVLLIIIPITNSFLSKPGKLFQTTGTIIKFIPLFVVLIGTIVVMANTGSNVGLDQSDKDTATNGFFLFLATMPAILFSFDGFIATSQLQKQGKKKNTYIKALVAALVTISVVYILIATFSFLAGDSNSGYSISAMLSLIFPNALWAQVLLFVIIFISGITGLNGFSMAGKWDQYNNSNEELIYDPEKKYKVINKKGIPTKSSLSVWIISMGWFITIFFISYFVSLAVPTYSVINVVDQLSNSYIVLAFLLYTAIILGALRNRKTGKHEVTKVKGFIPISIIVSISFIIINVFSFIETIQLISFKSNDIQLTGLFLILILIIWMFVSILNYISITEQKTKSDLVSTWWNDFILTIRKNQVYTKITNINYKNYNKNSIKKKDLENSNKADNETKK